MACLEVSAGFTDVTLSVNAWKSVVSIKAPANQMIRIRSLKFCGNGIAGDAEPCGLRWADVQASTGTATTYTPQKVNRQIGVTVQSVTRHTFTAEPTDNGTAPYIFPDKFHPQGGISNSFEFSNFIIQAGGEMALQLFVPTGGTAIKVSGHVLYEE